MSKTKHSPAPWRMAKGSTHESDYVIIGPRPKCRYRGIEDTWEIARIVNGVFPEHRGIDRANARLIIAAPELLTALNNALDHMEWRQSHFPDEPGYGVRDQRLAEGRAAIKKARGQ